jgi:hypothetical protein
VEVEELRPDEGVSLHCPSIILPTHKRWFTGLDRPGHKLILRSAVSLAFFTSGGNRWPR